MAEFTHLDVTYELVPTQKWSWHDALYAKKASGGMSVAQIERGVMDVDPDACIAMIAVSLYRARDISADEARKEIERGGGQLMQWLEDISRDEVGNVEGAVADPPPEGAVAPEEPLIP